MKSSTRGGVADAHLPGKFADYIGGQRRHRVERGEYVVPSSATARSAARDARIRAAAQHADDVPVAAVFAEVAESLVGIEEQVFVPA